MKNKIIQRILFLILGITFGLSITNFFVDRQLIKKLTENNEFKNELIFEYESYYNAAEDLISHDSLDSTVYYNTKNKLDSLYNTQL